jgi:hypothetical protein
VTETDHARPATVPPDVVEAAEWVRRNAITLAAVLMIALQLVLKGVALAHAYFRQDDFQIFDWALSSPLDWNYLMSVQVGHLEPVSLTLSWVLVRLSLYDWTLTSIVTLVLVAASGFAALRLLRTLFGNRPGILLPLLVYLFTPLMLPGTVFWQNVPLWLPMQLAIFMALNAHIVYVRGGRYPHAIAAAAWIGFGVLTDDIGVLIPLLIFALTSAFLVSGRWQGAALDAVRRYWKAWLLYAAVMAAYLAVFLIQLSASSQHPGKPGPFSNVLNVAFRMFRVTFIPGALGGPWRWTSVGDAAYAVAGYIPVLAILAWTVAVLVILASVWYRRRAWRAWAILALWIVLSAIAPLIVGRVGTGDPTVLGSDAHYLADSGPVLAVCLGLAFWPVTGEIDTYRGRPPVRMRRAVSATVLSLFLAGSLWSFHAFEQATSSALVRSYIATARAAVAGAPQGAVIADTVTPLNVENPILFGQYAYTGRVIGPLASALPGRQLHWVQAPSGVIPNLMIFDSLGRLWPATIGQGAYASAPARRGCWEVGATPVRLPFGTSMFDWPWTLGLSYRGSSATLAVLFGGRWHDVSLLAGNNLVYVPALGAGSFAMAHVVSTGPRVPRVCISHLSIGQLEPSLLGKPIPAVPVPG